MVCSFLLGRMNNMSQFQTTDLLSCFLGTILKDIASIASALAAPPPQPSTKTQRDSIHDVIDKRVQASQVLFSKASALVTTLKNFEAQLYTLQDTVSQARDRIMAFTAFTVQEKEALMGHRFLRHRFSIRDCRERYFLNQVWPSVSLPTH
jgi:hypothetical protein